MKKSTRNKLIKLSWKYKRLGNRMSEKRLDQKINEFVKGEKYEKQNKS